MQKMPDGNEAALRQYLREQDKRERFMPEFSDALDKLTDKIMEGETYPPGFTGRSQIHLPDILIEYSDHREYMEVIAAHVGSPTDLWGTLHDLAKRDVQDYLSERGKGFVEMFMDDLAVEAEEDARDEEAYAAELKRDERAGR